MEILVISDTHGSRENVNKVTSGFNFDKLFFLGDGISDLGTLANLENVKVVKGNCDFLSKEKIVLEFELEGVKFLLTHGHAFDVKSGLGAILNHAKHVGADCVLFGHTHECLNEVIDGIHFINPGSLSNNRSKKQTYGILKLENKKTEFKLMEL